MKIDIEKNFPGYQRITTAAMEGTSASRNPFAFEVEEPSRAKPLWRNRSQWSFVSFLAIGVFIASTLAAISYLYSIEQQTRSQIKILQAQVEKYQSTQPNFSDNEVLLGRKRMDDDSLPTSSNPAVCQDPNYSKKTLKLSYEVPFPGLFKDGKNEVKFEASDITARGDYYYAVCDSSWAISMIRKDLEPFSEYNILVGDPQIESGEMSGYEGIFYYEPEDIFYLVRESIVSGAQLREYSAVIEEIKIVVDEDSVHRVNLGSCRSEKIFEGDSKGFEGAAYSHGVNGDMYMMALCEGNHCSEGDLGKEFGNGIIIVMEKSYEEGECIWKTVREIMIPKSAYFQDYSAISINGPNVVITSQENSQIWVGKFGFGEDGHFDPETTEFLPDVGTVFDFPRGNMCEIEYCNIEGIMWVSGHEIVTVSDKMKSRGRQDFRCQKKDQSFHAFTIPELMF